MDEFPKWENRIRRAVLCDSVEIYETCVKSIMFSAPTHYSQEQISAWVARIQASTFRRKIPRLHFMVAEAELGVIAGFVALEPITHELEYIYVHPEFQRSGLGRQLLEVAEQHARDQGIRKLHLVGSLNALGFYEHLGFIEDRRILRDLSGTQVPCALMSKEI